MLARSFAFRALGKRFSIFGKLNEQGLSGNKARCITNGGEIVARPEHTHRIRCRGIQEVHGMGEYHKTAEITYQRVFTWQIGRDVGEVEHATFQRSVRYFSQSKESSRTKFFSINSVLCM